MKQVIRIVLLICMSNLACTYNVLAQNTEKITRLKSELQETSSDSGRSVLYRKLSLAYFSVNNETSEQYADKAVIYGRKAGNLKAEGLALQLRGYARMDQGKRQLAFEDLKRSMSVLEEAGHYTGVAVSSSGAAYCLEQQGRIDEALEIVLYGLEVIEEQGLSETQRGRNLVDLARIYRENNQTDEAIETYEEALKIARDSADHSSAGVIYMNMGNVYSQIGEQDKALDMFKHSLVETKRCDCKGRLTQVWLDLGFAANETGNADLVDQAINSADSAWLDRSNKEMQIDLWTLTGMGAQLRNQHQKAIKYLEKAYLLARKVDYHEKIIKVATALERSYAATNDKDKLTDLLLTVLAIKDSTYNSKMASSMADMQIRYETQKTEKELQRIESINSLNEQHIKQIRSRNNLLVGLAIIASLLAGVAFWAMKKARSSEQLLARQNDELGDLLDEKKVLLQEIHHRIKNNLQTISSLLNLQTRSTDDDMVKKAMQEGQGRLKSIALLHQKLYMNDGVSNITMQEYVHDLGEYIIHNFGSNDQQIQLEVDAEGVQLDLDTAIPIGLILNELITNCLKHAFNDIEQGRISISIKATTDDAYVLRLENNGKPLPREVDIETLPSLGLKLVRNLARQLRGSFSSYEQPQAGFMIHFREAV